jgi:long-subunit fatty acid transport protein
VSLEVAGRQNKTSSLRLAPLGSFFGVVMAKPLLSTDHVRLGFSISNPLDWEPGSIHFAPQLAPGVILSAVDDVSLQRTEPAVSIGMRVNERLRIGATVAVPITSLAQHQDMLLLTGDPLAGESRRLTFITDGQAYHLLGRVSAQFDITRPLSVGVRLESPGLLLSGSSRLQYVDENASGAGFESRALGETEADFDYRLPFSIAAGAAYQFTRGAIEADVHYYGEAEAYDLYESDTIGRHITSTGTGTTTTPLSLGPTPNSWRDVVNVAVGGNYRLTETLRVHAGVNSDGSPVGDPSTSLFRQVDLLGFSTGLSLTRQQFSGALGLGYSSGESDPVPIFTDPSGQPIATELQVRSFRVSFAVTFAFAE